MKDIDFDELDRAVGSVLGADAGQPAKNDVSDTTPVATLTDPESVSTLAGDASSVTPAELTTSPAALENESLATPEIKPAVSPARKRGQFLDMVHPSADMRKAPKMPPTIRKTVAPLNTSVVSGVSEVKPPADTIEAPVAFVPEAPAVAEPGEQAQSPLHTEQPVPKEAWPDPLDFATESAEASAVTQESAPASEGEPAADSSAHEATQTPFVPDAKVDKRPLDAFAASDGANNDASPAEAPAHPAESDGDAPEFNPAVNSVESVGVPQAEDEATGLTGEASIAEATADDATETSESLGELAPEPEVTPAPVTTVETEAKPETPVEPAAPVTHQAASISQQYKVATPAKEDNAARPLFDTEEYHQPLLPDGKKKTKKVVLIVLLLVVLLVIGGALGYIAFTVGI